MSADDLSWSEDAARPRPSREELRELYDRYLAEGHLVMGTNVEGDRDGAVWVGRCLGCDATHWGSHDATEATLLTYPELKWWQRGHRNEHGLAWQEWIPSVELAAIVDRIHGRRAP